jgi:hypothetical protein
MPDSMRYCKMLLAIDGSSLAEVAVRHARVPVCIVPPPR